MDRNPCARVTRPPPSTEVVRWLSDDERAALLAACKASDSPDLYAFVLFALTTGARKGEIAALEWAQVDPKRRWAIFRQTKNGEARGVPLTTAVCALLEARAQRRTRFPGRHYAGLAHGDRSRRDRRFSLPRPAPFVRPAMVQNGANLAEVAALLGHKNLQMT